jgi:hypothetical protein
MYISSYRSAKTLSILGYRLVKSDDRPATAIGDCYSEEVWQSERTCWASRSSSWARRSSKSRSISRWNGSGQGGVDYRLLSICRMVLDKTHILWQRRTTSLPQPEWASRKGIVKAIADAKGETGSRGKSKHCSRLHSDASAAFCIPPAMLARILVRTSQIEANSQNQKRCFERFVTITVRVQY